MHNHGGEIYERTYDLDYSVNVNCMGTPASVVEAAAKGAALSAQYPDVNCRELRKNLAAFLQVKENQIVFSNKGPTIPKEKLETIFEKFYRVSTGNRHDVKGFGLGLAYVHKLINQFKGSIHVESEINKGSKFIIILPLIK